MSRVTSSELRIRCLLEEYKECAECFRHTYATIWQAGILFATFSAAVFGFYFSFQDKLSVYLPFLPFISLGSIMVWWFMIFEPMNRYGDVRAMRCKTIEEELSSIVPDLKMRHFSELGSSKKKYLRVRNTVRILAIIIIIMMLLIGVYLLGSKPQTMKFV